MSTNANNKQSYLMLITSLFIVGTIGIFRRYIPLSSSLLAFFRGLTGSVSLFVFVKDNNRCVKAGSSKAEQDSLHVLRRCALPADHSGNKHHTDK